MLAALAMLSLAAVQGAPPPRFLDATERFLGREVAESGALDRVARVALADLDDDGWPDLVVDRHRVFMNRPDASGARALIAVAASGLDAPLPGSVVVFADLDDDGLPDAVVAEPCDPGNPDWVDHGRRTRWQRGRGDGSFEAPIPLPVPPRTTVAVAVGDVDGDGRLDLWFGNAYVRYGHGLQAWPNDLLLSEPREPGAAPTWRREALPEERFEFDEQQDLGPRPSYGVLVAPLVAGEPPLLLELSYGRRWNRLWRREPAGGWIDLAPALGVDGDAIRHGRHPEWLRERARSDPRFDRGDEKPFRSNGNTFDAALGDVDGDGRLDLLLTEITHAWAGDSSDRTRLLFQAPPDAAGAPGRFEQRAGWSLDRVPPEDHPDARRWNQGDLFGALADLDHDGRAEVIVSSGEYPDDERLRVWRVRAGDADPRLEEATAAWGIDHDAAQQIALGDLDGDGALDLVVGQNFNRYPPERIAERTARLRILGNAVAAARPSLLLRLEGDGRRVARAAIGAVVEFHFADGGRVVAPLVGPGGHAGKQSDLTLHVGLGGHERAERVVVHWPGAAPPTTAGPLPAGAWRLGLDGSPRPLRR